jgi:hypothetical protein
MKASTGNLTREKGVKNCNKEHSVATFIRAFGEIHLPSSGMTMRQRKYKILFSFAAIPNPYMLRVARDTLTTSILNDRTVLVAGGYNGDYLRSSEVYDPAFRAWSLVGSMNIVRR